MSRSGLFQFPTMPIPPLSGLKRGLAAVPDSEPGSKRTRHGTADNGFSMNPGSQLVPADRRSEMPEQEQQTYQQGPAYYDGEDSGEDNFHDAHEDPDFDLCNGGGEHPDPNTAPPQVQGYQPKAFTGHINPNAAFEQQPQPTNRVEEVIDITGHDGGEYANTNFDQLHDDFDRYAMPHEEFRDLGFDIGRCREEEEEEAKEKKVEQQPAQHPEIQAKGGFSFNGESQQYQEGQSNGNYISNEHYQQYQESQASGNHSSHEQPHNTGSTDSHEEDIQVSDAPNALQEDGLFASTWGNTKDEDADSDIEIVDAPASDAAQGLTFNASSTTNNSLQQRIPTPPLPGHSAPSSNTKPERKKREDPIKDVYGKPWDGRNKPGADVDRDLSRHLKAHFRFHSRVYDLVPRIPNWEDLDWNRRYWIAVLLEGKTPKYAHSERDFVWMKGNRFSSVRTVMEKFLQTTLGDRTSVLTMGYERVSPEDQMQELDYFGDRLCVFRVLPRNHLEVAGRSLVEGVVPEVIELDDD